MTVRSPADWMLRLLSERWTFSREGGKVFSDSFRFSINGCILNYDHPNEKRWRMRSGNLELLNADGQVTTTFPNAQNELICGDMLTGNIAAIPDGRHLLKSSRLHCLRPIQQAKLKVAVLIRTHVVNEKLYNLIDCIRDNPYFDVFVAADETRGKLPLEGVDVVSHSLSMCEEIGLNTKPKNHASALWLCGDYALYCSYTDIPQYDYYIMLEYDVHFTRQNSLFLEGLINRLVLDPAKNIDLVTTIITKASVGWPGGVAATTRYPIGFYGGIFALVAASRRAVEFLFEERRRESVDERADGRMIHCELFPLSALLADQRFNCTSLASIFPGSIGPTYHPGRPDLSEPNYLLGDAIRCDPRAELIHPVFDSDEFLKRQWQVMKAKKQYSEFLNLLSELEHTLVRDDLRSEYINRAISARADQSIDDSLNSETVVSNPGAG